MSYYDPNNPNATHNFNIPTGPKPFLTLDKLYKLFAFLIWCGGAYNTVAFLTQLGVSNYGYAMVIGVSTQLLLTFGQSRFWTLQRDQLSTIFLFLDVFTNTGAMYSWALGLKDTDTYLALAQALNFTNEMPNLVALFVALIVGVAIAAAPEWLWKQK